MYIILSIHIMHHYGHGNNDVIICNNNVTICNNDVMINRGSSLAGLPDDPLFYNYVIPASDDPLFYHYVIITYYYIIITSFILVITRFSLLLLGL